jgi:hypothetical protein
LLVTALVEAATGLRILFLPAVLFVVLLGLEHAAADTIFVGRLAGAELLAIGAASWVAKADARTPAQLGLLTGILIYDAAAAMLLAFAGLILKMNGVLLWPGGCNSRSSCRLVFHLFATGAPRRPLRRVLFL